MWLEVGGNGVDKTYLHLDDVPLLTTPRGKRLPDLLAHRHVLLAQPLELPVVEFVLTATLHQALVPLPARVARLGWEGITLDLVPVLARGPQGDQRPVVLRVPGAGGGANGCRQRPAHRTAHGIAGRGDLESRDGVGVVPGHG